ncbi:MAG: DNA-binding response regulator [Gammaproteobacteria bacterium]|nr:DNA-binding response regulator [Gammaproteobacteria bacterium]
MRSFDPPGSPHLDELYTYGKSISLECLRVKILLIEDDVETAQYLLRGLAEDGHQSTLVDNGREGLDRALSEAWDLLIVDRMLPQMDGLSLVQAVRRAKSTTAVLFLTTLGGVDDRVQGFNAGADDYLIKPFAFSELLARVAALGRRARRAEVETSLRFADLELDLLTRRVLRGGVPVDLLPREFRLLEYLMKHAGQVVTRAMLLENVWDIHFDPNTSVVETHVSRLRSKIDRCNSVGLIHTVRGSGYVLRAPQ